MIYTMTWVMNVCNIHYGMGNQWVWSSMGNDCVWSSMGNESVWSSMQSFGLFKQILYIVKLF